MSSPACAINTLFVVVVAIGVGVRELMWDAESGYLKKEKEGSDILLVKGEEVGGGVKVKEG